MAKKTRRQLLWLSIFLFLVIGPPLLLYAGGWRLASDLSIRRVGGIYVSSDISGSEIYVNDKLEKETNILQRGLFMQGITPGKVQVIAAKEGYWPWAKELDVKENFVTEARAFMLPRDIGGKSILRGKYSRMYSVPEFPYLMLEKNKGGQFIYEFYSPQDQQFINVINGNNLLSSSKQFITFFNSEGIFHLVFESRTVDINFDESSNTLTARIGGKFTPDPDMPALPHLIAADNRLQSRIWLSKDNTLMAEWISSSPLPYYFEAQKAKIFESAEPLKSFDFYYPRRDLVMLAVKNGVFVIELDGRGTRNFQPIYNGRDPYAARVNDTIYVLDNGNLMEVKI